MNRQNQRFFLALIFTGLTTFNLTMGSQSASAQNPPNPDQKQGEIRHNKSCNNRSNSPQSPRISDPENTWNPSSESNQSQSKKLSRQTSPNKNHHSHQSNSNQSQSKKLSRQTSPTKNNHPYPSQQSSDQTLEKKHNHEGDNFSTYPRKKEQQSRQNSHSKKTQNNPSHLPQTETPISPRENEENLPL